MSQTKLILDSFKNSIDCWKDDVLLKREKYEQYKERGKQLTQAEKIEKMEGFIDIFTEENRDLTVAEIIAKAYLVGVRNGYQGIRVNHAAKHALDLL